MPKKITSYILKLFCYKTHSKLNKIYISTIYLHLRNWTFGKLWEREEREREGGGDNFEKVVYIITISRSSFIQITRFPLTRNCLFWNHATTIQHHITVLPSTCQAFWRSGGSETPEIRGDFFYLQFCHACVCTWIHADSANVRAMFAYHGGT